MKVQGSKDSETSVTFYPDGRLKKEGKCDVRFEYYVVDEKIGKFVCLTNYKRFQWRHGLH
ncbi:hypothetical protein GYB57_09540 [bacterium]|nr:hypothetical protein [bacterium]